MIDHQKGQDNQIERFRPLSRNDLLVSLLVRFPLMIEINVKMVSGHRLWCMSKRVFAPLLMRTASQAPTTGRTNGDIR